jgi:hypothetical protein
MQTVQLIIKQVWELNRFQQLSGTVERSLLAKCQKQTLLKLNVGK